MAACQASWWLVQRWSYCGKSTSSSPSPSPPPSPSPSPSSSAFARDRRTCTRTKEHEVGREEQQGNMRPCRVKPWTPLSVRYRCSVFSSSSSASDRLPLCSLWPYRLSFVNLKSRAHAHAHAHARAESPPQGPKTKRTSSASSTSASSYSSSSSETSVGTFTRASTRYSPSVDSGESGLHTNTRVHTRSA